MNSVVLVVGAVGLCKSLQSPSYAGIFPVYKLVNNVHRI